MVTYKISFRKKQVMACPMCDGCLQMIEDEHFIRVDFEHPDQPELLECGQLDSHDNPKCVGQVVQSIYESHPDWEHE